MHSSHFTLISNEFLDVIERKSRNNTPPLPKYKRREDVRAEIDNDWFCTTTTTMYHPSTFIPDTIINKFSLLSLNRASLLYYYSYAHYACICAHNHNHNIIFHNSSFLYLYSQWQCLLLHSFLSTSYMHELYERFAFSWNVREKWKMNVVSVCGFVCNVMFPSCFTISLALFKEKECICFEWHKPTHLMSHLDFFSYYMPPHHIIFLFSSSKIWMFLSLTFIDTFVRCERKK